MILNADARAMPLADESVQTVVTSPPYWGLRDYGNQDRGIGLEDSPAAWVDAMVDVFREVWRVLRTDGTAWLNVGDAYASTGYLNPARLPIKPKDLIGLPWRLAFALQADGWYLRSEIIWAKPNPMPESVRDRPTKAHEQVFLLSKSSQYYYDHDAVRLPNSQWSINALKGRWQRKERQQAPERNDSGDCAGANYASMVNPAGANLRSVWDIPTHSYADAHFATFPPRLVEPCIKAGSAEGDVVLDPFAGSGTTGVVARKLVRRFVGLELNPDYCAMAERRIARECPPNLFDLPVCSNPS